MRSAMPTLEQVLELPATLRLTIPPTWEDRNGHVNVQHYTALYDLAGDPFMLSMGIDESYARDRRIGFFDLEHHTWFLDEIHVGHEVTAHSCLVARSLKRIQGLLFIVDATRGRLASALEFLSSAVDLETRRTTPIPAEVAQTVDRLIAEQRARGWALPTCGTLAP